MMAVAAVAACTSGHGGSTTGSVSSGSASSGSGAPAASAFGGSAAKISVTSGRTGKDWWTWAGSGSIPPAPSDAVPARTAQRYLVLDFWLKHSNAVVTRVDPAPVIAAVATGNAAQQLSDFANTGSGLAGGGVFGGDYWGYVAGQTATDAGSTVIICTVSSDAKAGGGSKPGNPALGDAITKNGPGAWTFHLLDVDGSWRVGAVADPSPRLPTSCQGWYAGLRAQAGLPAK